MAAQPGDLLSSFENLRAQDQQAFLSLLAKSLNVTALRTLQNEIDATRKLTRDFITELPLELVVAIFSFLPCGAAFFFQRVSKAWQAKLLATPMLQQMRRLWNEGGGLSEGECDPCSLSAIRPRVETMHRFCEGRPLTSFTVAAPFQAMGCDDEEGLVTDDILSIGPDDGRDFWVFNLRSGHASQHKVHGVCWAHSYQDRHSILFTSASSITFEHGFTVFRDDVAAQLVHIDTRSRIESKLLLPAWKVNNGARFAFTADQSLVAYYKDADGISDLGEIGLWRPADRRLVKIQVEHLGTTCLQAFTSSCMEVIFLDMDLDEASRTITLIVAADPSEGNRPPSALSEGEAQVEIMFSVKITYDPDILIVQHHQNPIKGDISVSTIRNATGLVLLDDFFTMIAELQRFVRTKHTNHKYHLFTNEADLEIDLTHNICRLTWSYPTAYMNASFKKHGVMYAITPLSRPANDEV